jgi:hypothetical protein
VVVAPNIGGGVIRWLYPLRLPEDQQRQVNEALARASPDLARKPIEAASIPPAVLVTATKQNGLADVFAAALDGLIQPVNDDEEAILALLLA